MARSDYIPSLPMNLYEIFEDNAKMKKLRERGANVKSEDTEMSTPYKRGDLSPSLQFAL